MIRLAKYISNCGFCSRRNAELLIMEQRVTVNNQIITTPLTLITGDEVVSINGQVLTPILKPRLWLYHKPAGLITTHHDPQARPTVFANLPSTLENIHLISVGRLDLNSEGLLLLTNSPALARFCELPANELSRTYKVRVYGKTNWNKMQHVLSKGITINDIYYKPIIINYLGITQQNRWLEVKLSEGKNREIRRVLEYFDLQVNRLIRTQYGPFALGELERGQVTEVAQEILKTNLSSFFSQYSSL